VHDHIKASRHKGERSTGISTRRAVLFVFVVVVVVVVVVVAAAGALAGEADIFEKIILKIGALLSLSSSLITHHS
jgi:hypothetical protein